MEKRIKQLRKNTGRDARKLSLYQELLLRGEDVEPTVSDKDLMGYLNFRTILSDRTFNNVFDTDSLCAFLKESVNPRYIISLCSYSYFGEKVKKFITNFLGYQLEWERGTAGECEFFATSVGISNKSKDVARYDISSHFPKEFGELIDKCVRENASSSDYFIDQSDLTEEDKYSFLQLFCKDKANMAHKLLFDKDFMPLLNSMNQTIYSFFSFHDKVFSLVCNCFDMEYNFDVDLSFLASDDKKELVVIKQSFNVGLKNSNARLSREYIYSKKINFFVMTYIAILDKIVKGKVLKYCSTFDLTNINDWNLYYDEERAIVEVVYKKGR